MGNQDNPPPNIQAGRDIELEIHGDMVMGTKISGDQYNASGDIHISHGLSAEQVAALFVEIKRVDQPTTWDGRIPYIGLTAFQESDAEFFFGRESLVDDLLERVQKSSFIVIAGPSGSGKSSVARAGLFHALRNGRLPKSHTWRLATMQPSGRPLEQLAVAIERLTFAPGSGNHIRHTGLNNALALHEQIQTILTDDAKQRFVLLVDQFEEVFTQTKEEAVRAAFIQMLTTAAQTPTSRAIIILSLRSDFISHCATYPTLRDLLSQQFQLVGGMGATDLAKAITLPALEVGSAIDPALVSRIMADMKGEPGALPLMSFALRDLFEVEKSKKGQAMDLTLPEYLQRGGIESALERHANQAFAIFSDAQRELAKGIFSKLIEVGRGGEADTRRTAVFTELIPVGQDMAAVSAVVEALTHEGVRLLTTSVGHAGTENSPSESTVTIAHEKLIEAWPWLRQLVAEKREIIALQNQISGDARLWLASGDGGYLYRGGRLLQVEEKLAELQPYLDALAQQFVAASTAERERQQAAEEQMRRKEAELRIQQEVKQRIQASQLVREAGWAREKNPEQSLLLAVAGLATSVQSNTHAGLVSSLQMRYRTTLWELEEGVDAVAFSPDGQTFLTLVRDGTVRLWNQEGQPLATLSNGGEGWGVGSLTAAVFSPDGTHILTSNYGGNWQWWTRNGQEEAWFSEQDRLQAVWFSPDGQTIVTTLRDGTSQLRDGQGQVLAELVGQGGAEAGGVETAVFAPGGQKMLISHQSSHTVLLYDGQGQQLTVLNNEGRYPVNQMLFSPAGDMMLTIHQNEVVFWDEGGQQLTTLTKEELGEGWVSSAVFSWDGSLIVTLHSDGVVMLWSDSGGHLARLERPESAFQQVQFSPIEPLLLTVNSEGRVQLWSEQGKELIRLGGEEDGIEGAQFSPDGRLIVTYGRFGQTRLWNGLDSELAVLGGDGLEAAQVVFSPDGQRVLTIGREGRGCLWEGYGRLSLVWSAPEEIGYGLFSPSGASLLTLDWFGREAYLCDRQGQVVTVLDLDTVSMETAVFSPDEQTILTLNRWAYGMILWDRHGQQQAVYEMEEKVMWGAFSPNGQAILSVDNADRVQMWDRHGRCTATLGESAEPLICAPQFSPDGQIILTARQNEVRLSNRVGQVVAQWQGHEGDVNSALFSPDGQMVLTASGDETARLWDRDGRELAVLRGHEHRVLAAVFSPDGQTILTTGYDNTARLWDRDGRELAVLREDGLEAAVFSPDGQMILTTNRERVCLWDGARQVVAVLESKLGQVDTAVFSPDGRLVLVAYEGGKRVRLWPAYTLAQMVQETYRRVKRGFTEEECQQYFRDDLDGCPRTKEELFAPLAPFLPAP